MSSSNRSWHRKHLIKTIFQCHEYPQTTKQKKDIGKALIDSTAGIQNITKLTKKFLLVQSLAIEIQAAQLRCAFCRCWWAIQPVSSRLKFRQHRLGGRQNRRGGRWLYGCIRPPHFWLPQHISVDTCSWMTCGRIHRG